MLKMQFILVYLLKKSKKSVNEINVSLMERNKPEVRPYFLKMGHRWNSAVI